MSCGLHVRSTEYRAQGTGTAGFKPSPRGTCIRYLIVALVALPQNDVRWFKEKGPWGRNNLQGPIYLRQGGATAPETGVGLKQTKKRKKQKNWRWIVSVLNKGICPLYLLGMYLEASWAFVFLLAIDAISGWHGSD